MLIKIDLPSLAENAVKRGRQIAFAMANSFLLANRVDPDLFNTKGQGAIVH